MDDSRPCRGKCMHCESDDPIYPLEYEKTDGIVYYKCKKCERFEWVYIEDYMGNTIKFPNKNPKYK